MADQQTYLYKSIEIFNKLPRRLTLIRNLNTFKRSLKKYKINDKIELKEQNDNEDDQINHETNPITIRNCQELYEDIII